MEAAQALAFVERHGIVLVSAQGAAANLVEFLAGEKVRGSWWSHRRARQIYAVLQSVTASSDVVVCRLVDGKRTLVHRRVWAALVRHAANLPLENRAALTEEHTPSGAHRVTSVPFPDWVPHEVRQEATGLAAEAAAVVIGAELLRHVGRSRGRGEKPPPRRRRGRP